MKKISLLFLPLMLVGLIISSSAQNCEAEKLNINIKDIVINNGLYYYENQLFTGDFHSVYSSAGSNDPVLNGFAQGSIVDGKRDGVWTWYVDDNLERKMIYKNGVQSKNKGDNFIFINGDKHTVLN